MFTLGRIAESLIRGEATWPFKTDLYSLAGHQKIMEGSVAPKMVSNELGIERFRQYKELSGDIEKLVQERSHSLFAESYSSQLDSTLTDTESLGSMLDNTDLEAGEDNFPMDDLVRFGHFALNSLGILL